MIAVAFLRGNAWIEMGFWWSTRATDLSHSCEGMRGLKYHEMTIGGKESGVAFLRGNAWIEI